MVMLCGLPLDLETQTVLAFLRNVAFIALSAN